MKSIQVVEMSKFGVGVNPYRVDTYHMGQNIGKNVTIMYANHSGEKCDYVILINNETGERVKIVFNGKPTNIGDSQAHMMNVMRAL